MPNDLYTKSGAPGTGSAGSSAQMRSEFTAIEAAFNKLPALSGKADLPVFVNADGTALETKSAAAVRALLDLVIGTNVQAYHATLAALSGIEITAAGLALLDDANAAAQLATLGALSASDFTGSHQAKDVAGYQELPGGYILQAGITAAVVTGGYGVTTFPTTFPHRLVAVIPAFVLAGAVSAANGTPFVVAAQSPSGFTMFNGGNGSAQYFYFAIGY